MNTSDAYPGYEEAINKLMTDADRLRLPISYRCLYHLLAYFDMILSGTKVTRLK